MRALDRPLQVGAEQPCEPVDCERLHGGFAILGEIGCQLARDLDHGKPRARHIAEHGRGARVDRFLEYELVALQPERISGKLDRHVLVAAEAKLADRLGVARGQAGLELDLPGGEHAGRGGHDGRAGGQQRPARFRLDQPVAPRDPRHGAEELDRRPKGELGHQRAEPLPAERGDLAFGRFGEIHRRDVAQGLAAPEISEHEFHRRAPVAEIVGQRLGARNVDLAAGRIGNAAIAAQEIGEEIFRFAFARIAKPDPQPLARRHRIDVEPDFDRELRQRIEIGHVDPTRPALIRNAEGSRVGEAAAAPALTRFQDHEPASGRGDAARGRNACSPGAHDQDVEIGLNRWSREHGRRRNGDGTGEKRAAVHRQTINY